MNENYVKGYKVFSPNWICKPTNYNRKRYTCPGKFEEEVIPIKCVQGMHFCKKAVDCFNYYDFNPKNKVAEVIAYGDVVEGGDKCCTNKLEIVREIPWSELLELVNTGKCCTGLHNNGNCNSGDKNNGNRNSGNKNNGNWNSGNKNNGNCNSGNYNNGSCNSGDKNNGSCNSGNYNSGNRNSGNYNSGNRNSGNYNSGNCNSGDWNNTDFSNGCFNTQSPKIFLFNKSSDWTYQDWLGSIARRIMANCPANALFWIPEDDMTEEEKVEHPECSVTGGFLKYVEKETERQTWWDDLSDEQKSVVMSIPNFDKDIFKEITGIDVER